MDSAASTTTSTWLADCGDVVYRSTGGSQSFQPEDFGKKILILVKIPLTRCTPSPWRARSPTVVCSRGTPPSPIEIVARWSRTVIAHSCAALSCNVLATRPVIRAESH